MAKKDEIAALRKELAELREQLSSMAAQVACLAAAQVTPWPQQPYQAWPQPILPWTFPGSGIVSGTIPCALDNVTVVTC